MKSARLIRIRFAGRRLEADACAQDREGDDEAREARHHDQQAGRDGEDRDQPDELHDRADRGAPGLACDRAEIDLLGQCRRDGQCKHAGEEERARLHSKISVLMRTLLTLPSLRMRARFLDIALQMAEAAAALDLGRRTVRM